MKRLIDWHLKRWKTDELRQPLLIRGARQVGKTHAVRELGKTFDHFVEINFELMLEAPVVFQETLDPVAIVRAFEALTGKLIKPGKALLFFDEVQACPQALNSLRFFYEMMPELHVIAAGSLLDFEIEKVGVPVGRIQSLFMYPLSFIEYLAATDEVLLGQHIMGHDLEKVMSDPLHKKGLRLVAEYLALGGMPAVIASWQKLKNARSCERIHKRLLLAYRQDFGKYAEKHQIKYVTTLFNDIPRQIGRKFKYSAVEGDYRKRELQPALNLLETAGLLHKAHFSSGRGIPLGSQAQPSDFKAIFLDVGLAQAALNLKLANWFVHPYAEFINKGALVEAFLGQELLAYGDPEDKGHLFYWHDASLEVDYLVQLEGSVIPVEVKSGDGRTLKSLHQFLANHAASPYGIRFSTHNYSLFEKIHSYPLYAVAKVVSSDQAEIKQAITNLFETTTEHKEL